MLVDFNIEDLCVRGPNDALLNVVVCKRTLYYERSCGEFCLSGYFRPIIILEQMLYN